MEIQFILAAVYFVLGILEITTVLILNYLESKKRAEYKSEHASASNYPGNNNVRSMAKQGGVLIAASLFIFVFHDTLSIAITGIIGFALVLLPPVFSIMATIFGGLSNSGKN